MMPSCLPSHTTTLEHIYICITAVVTILRIYGFTPLPPPPLGWVRDADPRIKLPPAGHGYVKAHRGFYHDAIFVKRNNFNLLLHETFGGGFSPPAVAKINRLARKAQRSGVDRTAYPPHSRLSFVSHHAERISIASVKGVNRAILDRRAKLASELSRRA